jgi:hypothetical protein
MRDSLSDEGFTPITPCNPFLFAVWINDVPETLSSIRIAVA